MLYPLSYGGSSTWPTGECGDEASGRTGALDGRPVAEHGARGTEQGRGTSTMRAVQCRNGYLVSTHTSLGNGAGT
jgi:hypothetical protein